MLIKGEFSGELKAFILQMNKQKQEDADAAIDAFCNKMENLVYHAVKSMQITIPTGGVQVQGTAAAQANIAPIVISGRMIQ